MQPWQLATRSLTLDRLPLVMGICNVTPDSFSDGGEYLSPDKAVAAALRMQADGAAIIDIGGESTRPFADPVDASEELARVLPVISALRGKLTIPISIDTSKSVVAEAAIQAGAEIINDVSGLEGDPRMAGLAADAKVGVCVMHMRGTPQTMQVKPIYDDVVRQIRDYLKARKQFCLRAGIAHDRICLDPGIGFGKTDQHNLELLGGLRQLTDLGSPILVGHSRKGFIGNLIGDRSADRTWGTLAVSMAVAAAGANIIRVHDVKPNVEALKLFAASGGLSDRRVGE